MGKIAASCLITRYVLNDLLGDCCALMEEDCQKILPGETEPVKTAEALREWAREVEF